MKVVFPILLSILLLAIAFLSFKLQGIEKTRRALKQSHVELSGVQYGLLSVDEWKLIVTDIIAKKINELDLKGKDKDAMREKISNLLYQLMDDYEASYQEEKSKTIGGILQGAVASLTGMFDKMRREVPNFTDRIMEFIEKPENRENLRKYILDKIETYADNTFAEIDYSAFNAILESQGVQTKAGAFVKMNASMDACLADMKPLRATLFLCVGCVILLLFFIKEMTSWIAFIITTICFCLLYNGVTMPMIDIDALIVEMKFNLLGEQVHFENQVLFYKSKSILEVTKLMIAQGKWDIILVGILIFAFSIFFPVLKLLTGLAYAFISMIRNNGFVKFVVFKTGKWSMADVMVVAIFMSYIGFSGILTDQLRQLQRMTDRMEILTTNESQLQLGFFIFTAFVIVSLLFSHKLQYQFKPKTI